MAAITDIGLDVIVVSTTPNPDENRSLLIRAVGLRLRFKLSPTISDIINVKAAIGSGVPPKNGDQISPVSSGL